MSLLQRGLMFVLAAGTLVLPSSAPPETRAGGRAAVTVDPQTVSVYTPSDKEYYLTEAQLDYIRPGLRVTINSVSNMEPGKKPVVEFTITDDFGNPLDRTGATTVGIVTYRFIPAVWDGKYYTDQLGIGGNPTRDNTGTTQTLEIGHYKYTFNASMPSTFDPTKPMTLFGGFLRNTTEQLGKNFYFQAFKDFVPSTGAAATTYLVTTTGRCNQCHDPLALHGGNYREIKTCALCHNPNNMVRFPAPEVDLRGAFDLQRTALLAPGSLRSVGGGRARSRTRRTSGTARPATTRRPRGAACGTRGRRAPRAVAATSTSTGSRVRDTATPTSRRPNDNECATCHIPTAAPSSTPRSRARTSFPASRSSSRA